LLDGGDVAAAIDQGERVNGDVARAGVVVPLVAAGEVVGALTVVRRTGEGTGVGLAELLLAEEVARRAAVAVQNTRLYQRAEAANRAKSDFLTIMSHELRTPLNAVVGYTDLLQEGVPGPLTPNQALYLERIRKSSNHLLSLIEEVLTYARLEAGRESVRREIVALDDLVRQASALVEPTAAARGLSYEVYVPEQDVRLETDARKVRQMLANLLSNAVKFTEQGSVVLTAREAGDDVIFEVKDTGIGIAPEHLERIFDAFWQVDSGTTRRAGGTGLGLGVTHRLAQLLGGEVTVQSELGQGSTFTLRLPRRVPSA
ncbi:MAG TPA: ATP-binding protein, partial [Longimicrobiales bacterium]